jgi:hypothetical protein
LLSGHLAQRLGIRAVFIACAGVLAVISTFGYFLMRGRSHESASSGERTEATAQSTAANQQS